MDKYFVLKKTNYEAKFVHLVGLLHNKKIIRENLNSSSKIELII